MLFKNNFSIKLIEKRLKNGAFVSFFAMFLKGSLSTLSLLYGVKKTISDVYLKFRYERQSNLISSLRGLAKITEKIKFDRNA